MFSTFDAIQASMNGWLGVNHKLSWFSEERTVGSPWGAVVATPEQRELKDYPTMVTLPL